jgi:hypothetical protein
MEMARCKAMEKHGSREANFNLPSNFALPYWTQSKASNTTFMKKKGYQNSKEDIKILKCALTNHESLSPFFHKKV